MVGASINLWENSNNDALTLYDGHSRNYGVTASLAPKQRFGFDFAYNYNDYQQNAMLIKTGGGDPATGAPEGIHWHMNIANEIRYVSTDEHRQVIPYVHVKDMGCAISLEVTRERESR